MAIESSLGVALTINPPASPALEPLYFQASWNDSNKELQDTTINKITRFALCLFNFIAKTAIVPSTWSLASKVNQEFDKTWYGEIDNYSRPLRTHYTPQPFEVTTPDGEQIRGTYFKRNNLPSNAPTVLCFQANQILSKQGYFDWLIAQSADYGYNCHFITFDYRGTGDNFGSGPAFENDLILDGDSIYQLATKEFGVSPENIRFYGHSLGGSVSAHVKALHTEATGNYVNERSFASLHHYIDDSFIGGTWIGSFVKKILSALNWRLDSEAAVRKMKGRKLVVHHPRDKIVGGNTGLHNALFNNGAPPSDVSILDLSLGEETNRDLHCCRMEHFRNDHFNPEKQIVKFLATGKLD